MSRENSILRDRNFTLYFTGVVGSEIGIRGTLAINLYHVYLLTDSTALVGIVGLAQLVAVVTLSPISGVVIDRVDRRRLIQVAQFLSLVISAALAVLTFMEIVSPIHIYFSVLLNTAASTFDNPARKALLTSIVDRTQLVQAFALVNPGRELAVLVGPAVGGLLVAVGGPGLMYAVDAGTYALLIVVLAIIEVRDSERSGPGESVAARVIEGFSYVRKRPIIWQLMALDFAASVFGAYRVILPELAEDILGIGAVGYGALAAMPPLGALVGSWVIYTLIGRLRAGHVALWSTVSYGLACIALAFAAPFVALVFLAAVAAGAADACGTTVRHAAVQLETPEHLLGRVLSFHQVASRGGPALGTVGVGWAAGLLGPVAALAIGGTVPVMLGAAAARLRWTVRDYDVPKRET